MIKYNKLVKKKSQKLVKRVTNLWKKVTKSHNLVKKSDQKLQTYKKKSQKV